MRGWIPVLLLGAALGAVQVHVQTATQHIRQTLPPDENPQYFPIGLFSEFADASEWVARWYASELRKLAEPSLWTATPKQGAALFRFTVIPCRAPSFIVRLAVDSDGSGTLTTKWRVRSNGATEASDVRQESMPVGSEQVKKFVELLNDADFWSMPAEKPAQGLDGQEWLLESKQNGEYHIVDRWNGVMEDSYHKACEYLYKLGFAKAN